MRRKGNVKLVVAVIVAMIGLIIIWNIQSDATADLQTSSTLLNYTSAPTTQEFTLSPVGQELRTDTFTLTNSSGTAFNQSNFTITDAGALTFTNSENQTNMNASWTFEPTGFVSGALTRTILAFVSVFFAVLILAMLAFAFRG